MSGLKQIKARRLKMGVYDDIHPIYLIKFPYMTQSFIFVGGRESAEKAAMELARKTNYPYRPNLRSVVKALRT